MVMEGGRVGPGGVGHRTKLRQGDSDVSFA